MGPIQTLEDLIGLIWRRRILIATIVIVGSLFGAWYAKSRPDLFETAAVIQVQQASVSGRAEGAQANPLQVLQSIEQRLTTRDNLIALIERHALFADQPGLSLEDKVAAMRASIRFQAVSNATGGSLSAIIIAAQAGKAEDAARIANDLAQSILDLGAEGRQAVADATYGFYKAEEARIWQELTALEAEVAAYREANRGALPAAREARQDEAVQVTTELRSLDQELAGLQSEEALIRANQTLRATDRRRLDEIAQRKAVITAQREPLAARKAALEQDLVNAAEIDRALSAYQRQLGQLQDQYTVVSQRLAEAETTRRLAESQQTERFALLERAIIPQYPLGSGGKKLAIAGAIASTGLALAIAFLLDLVRPVVRSSSQLQRELNIRPIVAIPEVPSRARVARGRSVLRSLIESEAARLRNQGMAGNALILGGAAMLVGMLVLVA